MQNLIFMIDNIELFHLKLETFLAQFMQMRRKHEIVMHICITAESVCGRCLEVSGFQTMCICIQEILVVPCHYCDFRYIELATAISFRFHTLAETHQY